MNEDFNAAASGAVVAVVDDDPSVRNALDNLISSVGLTPFTFASAAEFRKWPVPDAPLCLVLDVRMPGRNGLDVQEELAGTHGDIPVIFITAHGDIPMSVRAMKAGAIEFLTKPFRDQDLLDAIYQGLALSQKRLDRKKTTRKLDAAYGSLSPREREVMEMVVKGKLTKQIAAQLGLSEITVKVCRAQMMKKMDASSLADLVRMAERLADRKSEQTTEG